MRKLGFELADVPEVLQNEVSYYLETRNGARILGVKVIEISGDMLYVVYAEDNFLMAIFSYRDGSKADHLFKVKWLSPAEIKYFLENSSHFN